MLSSRALDSLAGGRRFKPLSIISRQLRHNCSILLTEILLPVYLLYLCYIDKVHNEPPLKKEKKEVVCACVRVCVMLLPYHPWCSYYVNRLCPFVQFEGYDNVGIPGLDTVTWMFIKTLPMWWRHNALVSSANCFWCCTVNYIMCIHISWAITTEHNRSQKYVCVCVGACVCVYVCVWKDE